MTTEEFDQAEAAHIAFLHTVRDFAAALTGTHTSGGLPVTSYAVNGALRSAGVPVIGEDAQPVTLDQLFEQRAQERAAHRETVRRAAVQAAAQGDITTDALQGLLSATSAS